MRHFSDNERLLIIFKRREEKLAVYQVAEELLMSKSNLSRIENGKIMVSITNEKLLEERFSIDFSHGNDILSAMKIKLEYLIQLLIFYRLFDDYSKDKVETIDTKSKKSIAYPYYMLVRFFIYSLKGIEERFIEKYFPIFDELIELFSDRYKKIFLIAKASYFYQNKQFKNALELCGFIEKKFDDELLLDSYLFHLKANIYNCMGLYENVIESIQTATRLAELTNNSVRLLALNITKANCERVRRNFEVALKYDCESLDYGVQKNIHIYDYALLRNIAWTNYLLGNYEESMKNYKLAEKISIDDDLCFMTALCSFKLGLRQQCAEYITKGRRVPNAGVAFPYLIDWMELTLNKKFSKRAEQKLLQCLRKYEDKLHFESRDNIYKLLIEHYTYHNNLAEAHYYSDKLNTVGYIHND